MRPSVHCFHLGNMLIKIQWDIFSPGNIFFFFKSRRPINAQHSFKFSSSGGACEPVLAAAYKYSQIDSSSDLEDDLNPMKSTSNYPVMSQYNKDNVWSNKKAYITTSIGSSVKIIHVRKRKQWIFEENNHDLRLIHVTLTFNHFENFWNRFSISENHKIDTKIIKIGSLVTEMRPSVDGGHLGNMLIRIQWDIFAPRNIFFLQK